MPSPFYNYFLTKPARTRGADAYALQPMFELPCIDASGPTDPNKRPLSFFQGAVNAGPQVLGLQGTQGVINDPSNGLGVSGLLDIYGEDEETANG